MFPTSTALTTGYKIRLTYPGTSFTTAQSILVRYAPGVGSSTGRSNTVAKPSTGVVLAPRLVKVL